MKVRPRLLEVDAGAVGDTDCLRSSVPAGRFARALTTMLGHTRARLAATAPDGVTAVRPSLQNSSNDAVPTTQDGVDSGRPPQSVPPLLPLDMSHVTMLHSQMPDSASSDVVQSGVVFPAPLQNGDFGQSEVVGYDDLQALLGNGSWAPWFQNSVRPADSPFAVAAS